MVFLIALNGTPTLMFFLGGTGLGPGLSISKNGGSFASSAGSVTEIANGWYAYTIVSGESDTAGPLAFHFSAGTFQDFLCQVAAPVSADVAFWASQAVPNMVSSRVPVLVDAMANAVITSSSLNANVVPFLFSSTPLTESYAADGAPATLTQLLYMLWSALGEFAISGTTLTCKKLDGTTTSMQFTLSPSGNPTSRTRSA